VGDLVGWLRRTFFPTRIVRLLIQFRAIVAIVIVAAVSVGWAIVVHDGSLINALGFGGFAAAIAQLVLEAFNHIPVFQTKRVLFFGKSKSPFNRAVLNGVREVFSNNAEFELHERLVATSNPEQFARELDDAYADHDFRAVIVRPLESDVHLQKVLTRILSDGVFVVVVDINVEREDLPRHLRALPFFVGSDFAAGGAMLATLIRERVVQLKSEGRKPLVLSLLGPVRVPTAVERGKSFVWELDCTVRDFDTTAIALDTFSPDLALGQIRDAFSSGGVLNTLIGRFDHLVLFGGNDNICLKLSEGVDKLAALMRVAPDNVELVGYDGVRDATLDAYVLQGRRAVVATIDTLPSDQGKLAAQIVMDAAQGRLSRYRSEKVVKPLLVTL
jgi:ABC-type sugar transport system substrate-binding protein